MTARERLTRIADALARVDVAIEALGGARNKVTGGAGIPGALPPENAAHKSVEEAYRATQVARFRLEDALKRCP